MWNWRNNVDDEHKIYYSRYIASWLNAGGSLKTLVGRDLFKDWLKRIGVNENDIHDIYEMATNGKLELETNAKLYLELVKSENNGTLMTTPEVLKKIFEKED